MKRFTRLTVAALGLLVATSLVAVDANACCGAAAGQAGGAVGNGGYGDRDGHGYGGSNEENAPTRSRAVGKSGGGGGAGWQNYMIDPSDPYSVNSFFSGLGLFHENPWGWQSEFSYSGGVGGPGWGGISENAWGND